MRCSAFLILLCLGMSMALNKRLLGLKKLTCGEIKSILDDETEIKYYIDCVLSKGPCDFIGTAIKQALKDFKDRKVLCQGCDEDQSGKANYIFERVSGKPIFTEVSETYNVPASFKPAKDAYIACTGDAAA